MSKTTNKLGKPINVLRLSIDAAPGPTPEMKAHWKELDKLAAQEYGKPYDAITNAQKTELHFKINTGAFKPKEEKVNKAKRGKDGNYGRTAA